MKSAGTIISVIILLFTAAVKDDEVFAQTGTWTIKTSMPTPRSHLAVGEVNGVLYAVGGMKDRSCCPYPFIATVEAYDGMTDTWTSKASMPTPRADLGLGVINGVLYAVGGNNGDNAGLTTVEAYDPASDTWTTKASMPTSRYGLGVAVVNGLLYAVGGHNTNIGSLGTVEAYDPVSDTWTTKASMPTPRNRLAAVSIGGFLD